MPQDTLWRKEESFRRSSPENRNADVRMRPRKPGLFYSITKYQGGDEYPNIARLFYNRKHQTVEIIKLNGSIELAPIVGLSDVIVDIVETGGTLKENGLVVLEKICDLSARVIVNRVSMKRESEKIGFIIDRLKGLAAEENK